MTTQISAERLANGGRLAVGVTNATIADGQGVGTILDEEPRITINDVTTTEDNSGLTAFAFTVNLSEAYDVPVTVDYATANGSATGAAILVAKFLVTAASAIPWWCCSRIVSTIPVNLTLYECKFPTLAIAGLQPLQQGQ